MELAFCLADQRVWSAIEFSNLPSVQLESYRSSLCCTECQSLAWFTKASRSGKPAYFASHHIHNPNCSLKIAYERNSPVDQASTISVDRMTSSGVMNIELGEAHDGPINVVPVVPGTSPLPGGSEGDRHIKPFDGRQTSANRSLRQLLYFLVQSSSYRNSSEIIHLTDPLGNILLHGPMNTIVVEWTDYERMLSTVGSYKTILGRGCIC